MTARPTPTLYHKPKLPLAEPLRGRETGTFTYSSIVERLPEIARRNIAENEYTPAGRAAIEQLIREIPDAPLRPLQDSHAPDTADWQEYLARYPGQNWLDVPWFLAEEYFYRRILEATGYFEPGEGYLRDPFAYQKEQALLTSQGAIEALPAVSDFSEAALAGLLHMSLWANQADLSLWPVGGEERPGHAEAEQARAHLLADETEKVLAHLRGRQGVRLDFLIDNAGFEFVCDLRLADFLLESGTAGVVYLHLKSHPTFVSDAIVENVGQTVDFLAASGQAAVRALGERLRMYVAAGRLRPVHHLFWTSPLPGWEMPEVLRRELTPSHLIISKGDANYRRLLGDAHWPFTTPFAKITSYLPVPLLALRTAKSEVVAGLRPGQPEQLFAQEPDWLINGRWGLIQFVDVKN
jgi:uncharacterized protein with ATP-grasp and redox domains